jgi:hypothetical protein
MGSKLPAFIESMSPAGRFMAVGALYSAGGLPEAAAVELLFRPGNVVIATNPHDLTVDEIYAVAELIMKDEHPLCDLPHVMGLAGLDWPRGSGDYHGGKPRGQMSKKEKRKAADELANVISSLDPGWTVSA